jgi:hypothetical protein
LRASADCSSALSAKLPCLPDGSLTSGSSKPLWITASSSSVSDSTAPSRLESARLRTNLGDLDLLTILVMYGSFRDLQKTNFCLRTLTHLQNHSRLAHHLPCGRMRKAAICLALMGRFRQQTALCWSAIPPLLAYSSEPFEGVTQVNWRVLPLIRHKNKEPMYSPLRTNTFRFEKV